MTNKVAAWTIAAATAFLALSGAVATRAVASEPTRPMTSEAALRSVSLGIGKSMVVDLPRDAKDVLVSDPTIANAVVRTARRAYLIGVKIGQTNVFFFDGEGRQIAGFDIAVKRDLNGIRVAIKHAIPSSDVRVEAIGVSGIILTGTVATPAEAQQAFDIATRLLDSPSSQTAAEGSKIVNAINVRDRDQVMLKVSVAEIQRDIIKQLGIDLNGSLGYGNTVLNFNTDNPFSQSNGPISGSEFTPGFKSGSNTLQAKLRAMERAGVIRTLAEPNLSAISGETANFLVGGEFPVVAGATCTTPTSCTPTVQFKKFGVSLTFTPVVLSEGRISLKVGTEVSELSSEGALQSSGFIIPSLRVRRADTMVEIPSGGALAMAGLIQEQTKQAINGFPGLMQVPVLGTLFKSRDYVNRQSELVIIVTPYIVRAIAPKDLSKPDDGFADSSDPTAILLGKFNKLYGAAGNASPRQPYRGQYGYILD
ncbi:MAG: type II and III secretion system protein family protein [Variibacter sp.]